MKKFFLLSVTVVLFTLLSCNGGSGAGKNNQAGSTGSIGEKDTVFTVTPLDIEKTFVPCGWMGDGEMGEQYITYDPNCTDNPHSAPACIKISYKPGPKKWAGIYWLNKDCNWGDEQGFNLSGKGYVKITFWAKGLKGNESVQFKAGGVKDKRFKDSFDYEPKLSVALGQEWMQYTLDLRGKNLSNVIGGFCWVANSNVTFFLDDILFE